MVRFIFAVLVIVPAIMAAEKQGRSLGYPVSGSQTTGAAGAQYSTVGQGSEVHDKKNFGLNFSSDKGASNSYTGTNFAGGLSGANQQGVGYVPYNTPYYPYPQYPYPYPYPHQVPYPGYPTTQGVGAGVGIVGGPGSFPGVQGVNAGAGAIQTRPAPAAPYY